MSNIFRRSQTAYLRSLQGVAKGGVVQPNQKTAVVVTPSTAQIPKAALTEKAPERPQLIYAERDSTRVPRVEYGLATGVGALSAAPLSRLLSCSRNSARNSQDASIHGKTGGL
jgi:hypothetical protein